MTIWCLVLWAAVLQSTLGFVYRHVLARRGSFDTCDHPALLSVGMMNDEFVSHPAGVTDDLPSKNVDPFKNTVKRAMYALSAVVLSASKAVGDASDVMAKSTTDDVGFINLNETEPVVTDVAYMDIQIGNLEPKRIEIDLYGTVAPQTVSNFKDLCLGTKDGIGYKGSEIFRVISSFSIQGGNIGSPSDSPRSRIGRYGKAASEPFAPENFRILHDSPSGGVVSMMKDLTNKGKQDSRFFITTSPSASWADSKYSAFGKVSKGLDYIISMQVLPTVPPSNYPETPIKILNAGIL